MAKFHVKRGVHVDPVTGGTFPKDAVVDSDFNLDKMDPEKYQKVTDAEATKLREDLKKRAAQQRAERAKQLAEKAATLEKK